MCQWNHRADRAQEESEEKKISIHEMQLEFQVHKHKIYLHENSVWNIIKILKEIHENMKKVRIHMYMNSYVRIL